MLKIDTIDVNSVTKSIVNHVGTSLARQAYNLDDLGMFPLANYYRKLGGVGTDSDFGVLCSRCLSGDCVERQR